MGPKLPRARILSLQDNVSFTSPATKAFPARATTLKIRSGLTMPCLKSRALAPSGSMLTKISDKNTRRRKRTAITNGITTPNHGTKWVFESARNLKFVAQTNDMCRDTHSLIADMNFGPIRKRQTRDTHKKMIGAKRKALRSSMSMSSIAPSGARGS